MRGWLTFLMALFLLLPAYAGESGLRAGEGSGRHLSPDGMLAKALQEVRAGRLDAALASVNQILSLRPDFRLAHLIRGDLLMARARPLATLGDAPRAPPASLSDLREEARVRLLRYLDEPEPNHLPMQLLQLSPEHRYVLLADASRARLYVFENVGGVPRLVRDYYMSIGRNGIAKREEGDKKTPVGLYTITRHLPRQQLIDFYGSGAYPLDYPNEWDRMHGRTGHGIWLHGTPSNTYSRPPKSSDGCVVLANPDLDDLGRYIQVGTTPILIAERTEWVDPVLWELRRQEMLTLLDLWRSDWESREVGRFFRHYAPEMLGRDWAAAKRRNIENKEWIRLQLSNVAIYLPSANVAVVTFLQGYNSDSFNNTTRKRLYWRLDGGQWRIALEQGAGATNRVAARTR